MFKVKLKIEFKVGHFVIDQPVALDLDDTPKKTILAFKIHVGVYTYAIELICLEVVFLTFKCAC